MFTGDQDLSFVPKVHSLNQYLLKSPRTILEWDSAYAKDKEPGKKEICDPERCTG